MDPNDTNWVEPDQERRNDVEGEAWVRKHCPALPCGYMIFRTSPTRCVFEGRGCALERKEAESTDSQKIP